MPVFKPYLLDKGAVYKGGKSKSEVQSDKPIFKLSSNENPLGASPLALAAIKANLEQLNRYPDRTDQRLRIALSEFYQHDLTPDQFFTANSGVGILQMIVHAFLGEDLECIYSNPAFEPYPMFSGKVGAKAIDVPLLTAREYAIDVEGILAAITDRTRVIWLCSPNNPTGTHIPKKTLERLLDQVPNHVVIVFDEVYHQFATALDYTTALPFVRQGKNVIAVNSFSKAYGLAGMRIGYGYATPEISRYISKTGRPFLLNTLALEAAIAALQDQKFIADTVQVIQEGKEYLYPELDQMGIQYWKGQGNFILLKPTMEDLEFEAKMLAEGIMVRPVAGFGAPGCIRTTIGTMEANRAFVRALKTIL